MTPLLLSALDKRLITAIKMVGHMADKQKVAAYIVGGLVRDLLLKKKNLDLDIVVEGNAILIAKALASKARAQILTHLPFKTATVTLPNGLSIDFVTARREFYPTPGALPVVEPAGMMDDLFRRDFTINAMAVSINKKTFGHLLDPYGGASDLKLKLIRVMHHDSFVDDPTRLLRALRYAARLNFVIEAETARLMREAAVSRGWMTVKPPRYIEEFNKLLLESSSIKGVSLAYQHGLLHLPMMPLALSPQRLTFAQRWQVLMSKEPFRSMGLSAVVMWMMTLNDLWRQDELMPIAKHLQLPIAVSHPMQQAMTSQQLLAALALPHLSPWQVYQMLRPLDGHVLLWLYVQASPRALLRIKRFILKDRELVLKISGDDVKKLGITQGVMIKRVLDGVLSYSINQSINDRAKQMALAKQIGGCYAHGTR